MIYISHFFSDSKSCFTFTVLALRMNIVLFSPFLIGWFVTYTCVTNCKVSVGYGKIEKSSNFIIFFQARIMAGKIIEF